MDVALTIYIGVFVIALIATVVTNLICEKKKAKSRELYFSKENLEEYEKILEVFFEKNSLKEGSNIYDIIGTLGYKIEEKDGLLDSHEAVLEDKTIIVDKNLSLRTKNFSVAHELAHIIRGTKQKVIARDPHSLKGRTLDEQICDYIAAALLLPYVEIKKKMDDINYSTISRREKFRFISALADEKNVCEEVVIRRVREIKLLEFK